MRDSVGSNGVQRTTCNVRSPSRNDANAANAARAAGAAGAASPATPVTSPLPSLFFGLFSNDDTARRTNCSR
jgi:hypothetical protein